MDILGRRAGRTEIHTFHSVGKSLPSGWEFLGFMLHDTGIGHVLGLAGGQEIQCVAPRDRRFAVFAAHVIGILLDQVVDFLFKIRRRLLSRP
jgi:hypothetical protein